jgi:ribosome modulation factor
MENPGSGVAGKEEIIMWPYLALDLRSIWLELPAGEVIP